MWPLLWQITPTALVNLEQPVVSVEWLHSSKVLSDPEQVTLESTRGRLPSLNADPGKASAPGKEEVMRRSNGGRVNVVLGVGNTT